MGSSSKTNFQLGVARGRGREGAHVAATMTPPPRSSSASSSMASCFGRPRARFGGLCSRDSLLTVDLVGQRDCSPCSVLEWCPRRRAWTRRRFSACVSVASRPPNTKAVTSFAVGSGFASEVPEEARARAQRLLVEDGGGV